jgi:hypothetical protein
MKHLDIYSKVPLSWPTTNLNLILMKKDERNENITEEINTI